MVDVEWSRKRGYEACRQKLKGLATLALIIHPYDIYKAVACRRGRY